MSFKKKNFKYNNDYEDQRPAFKDFKSIRWYLI